MLAGNVRPGLVSGRGSSGGSMALANLTGPGPSGAGLRRGAGVIAHLLAGPGVVGAWARRKSPTVQGGLEPHRSGSCRPGPLRGAEPRTTRWDDSNHQPAGSVASVWRACLISRGVAGIRGPLARSGVSVAWVSRDNCGFVA